MVQIRPQLGPQERFLATAADIAVYGGAAGGGKSYGLLLDARPAAIFVRSMLRVDSSMSDTSSAARSCA
jgi:hypothetical protein